MTHVRLSEALDAVRDQVRQDVAHLGRPAKIEAAIAALETDLATIAQARGRALATIAIEVAAHLADEDERLELSWTGDAGRLVVKTPRADARRNILAGSAIVEATPTQSLPDLTGAEVTYDIRPPARDGR